eukprot:TRINITY_DN4791_c0_g1_i5.p1 TRINITY_DN4791_c0_g1~~TRINITY_DN4791_c0_g1_i5.p1  ORF type:complete len:217 (+),score=105.81 TRINITY_DN4791_c0_g1_i5:26-676(+)
MAEDRQIQSMIDFIEREAHEKAEELDQAAQEEYDVEKMRLVEAEKAKIRTGLEKKKKQVEIDRRVASAHHSKKQRIRLMEERGKVLDDLKDVCKSKILGIVQDAKQYKVLMATLINQSVAAIQDDCLVQCASEDEAIVKALFSEAQAEYTKNTGNKVSITMSADKLNREETWGGVIVRSADGRITCNNTLVARMSHCFEEQLPRIRFNLLNPDAKV